MLSLDYLIQIEQQARRFSGAYTGTSGSLAAAVIHLLNERRTMQQAIDTLEQHNQALRDAVAARLEATAAAPEPETVSLADTDSTTITSDWILRGHAELQRSRQLGDGLLASQPDMGRLDVPESGDEPEAERLLTQALAVVRNRRPLYGGPREHFRRTVGMINAAFADVLNRPLTEADWALFMTLDKVSRYLGPTKTPDQITDLAGYAACLAECEKREPHPR